MVLHSLLQPKILSNGHQDLRLQLCRLSSPTLKTCNTYALKVDSYKILCMQSQPLCHQSWLLQQIHTWRSCNCADLANASSAARPAT